MLKKILNFLSLGNKSDEQIQHNIVEILNSDLSKKKNLVKLEEWACNEYLNFSDEVNEQKYKIVLLSFIFNSRKIYLESMPKLEKQVNHICNYLCDENSSLSNLSDLFFENPGQIISHSDWQQYIDYQRNFYISSLGLLKNIFNQNENLDICKKIYQEFSSLGLLGSSLTSNTVGAKFLLLIQDNKLSEKDFLIFKNVVSHIDEIISKEKEIQPIFMDYEVYNKIVVNEHNIENLKILLRFCNNNEKLEKMNNSDRERDYLSIRDMLNTKIEYLEMKSELDKPTCIIPSNNKKNKI